MKTNNPTMSLRACLSFVKRMLLGKEILIFPQIKRKIRWMGDKNAGFFVVPELLNEHSIVFSFGVGENASFDQDLINTFSCTVYAFDPTPKSIKFVENSMQEIKKFHFYPFGIYNNDCDVDFFLPKNTQHVSGSTGKEGHLEERIRVPMKKYSSILKELAISKIDLLKMDIEGSEYDIIDDILHHALPAQILVEFHHRFETIGLDKTKDFIKKMNTAGYKIAAISPSREEYTFVLVEGKHKQSI